MAHLLAPAAILSGTDLRQALQAGLWEALADGSDRAALRATCRDAWHMADELHDTALLPVGPDTWDSAANIAAYHRRLGTVQSVHVVYSGGAEDDVHAVHFMEAYSAALGAPLTAAACSMAVTREDQQLPTALAAVLLQRVVPHVERLDMALGCYENVAQLLQALEPCARMCSLRLLPLHAAEGPDDQDEGVDFHTCPRVLDALCRLPRLHTLSGPWAIYARHLQRLCDALPSLTTLGFAWLNLYGASSCISRQMHTLAAWRRSAGHDNLRLDRPWYLQDSTCWVATPQNLQTALPAVRHLDALVLNTGAPGSEELSAMQAAMQRFAACAERWAWTVSINTSQGIQVFRGMLPGSVAALQHLAVFPLQYGHLEPADVASALDSLVSAAPNITTLRMYWPTGNDYGGPFPHALKVMLQPFRRAAHLRTLWLGEKADADDGIPPTAAGQAALLEGVVRCLSQPGAEGGDEYCRALQHVLLAGAQPDALAACREALARDGICHVSVGTCEVSW